MINIHLLLPLIEWVNLYSYQLTRKIKKTRRYVIVIIFTAAAILTPPDPITQIGLAIPLLLLYELSILTVKFTEKKDKEVEDA